MTRLVLGLCIICATAAHAQDPLPPLPQPTALPLAQGLGGLMRLQPGVSQRASSSAEPWQDANNDAWPIEPGETITLAELTGPGVITHLWNTVNSPEPFYSRLLIIRMYWDGEDRPSVEAPLGDFFGIGHGLDVPFDSEAVRVTSAGRARNCYWRMPFRSSARITVTNEGLLRTNSFYSYVDWIKLDTLPDETPYFHAMYRQEHPAVMGQNYLLADIAGRGHYVGTVLNVKAVHDSWYGEGDDFFFIDGSTEPTLKGTGTEDYFGDAWGFQKQSGPYYGAPQIEIFKGGRNSMYRWHILDPIVFTQSLRAEIEHKGFPGHGADYTERADHFSSVAYWYQLEPHKAWDAPPSGYDRLYYTTMVENIVDMNDTVEARGKKLQDALAGEAVTILPVILKAATFTGGSATVVLKNPAAQMPAHVHAVFQAAAPLTVEPAELDLNLGPLEEKTVEIALKVDGPVDGSALSPILTDWTFTYAPSHNGPVAANFRESITIDAPYTVARRDSPVTVDGNLDEWPELPFNVEFPAQIRVTPSTWEGSKDLSFRFAVAEDDTHVYIAIKTTDDKPLARADRAPWHQDGVEVRVDARPDPVRSAWNVWGGEFEKFLFIALLPADTAEDTITYERERLPNGGMSACVRTAEGHNTEIAIPHAALDAYRGAPWDALRVNIAIDDFDAVDGQLAQCWWRPDWRFELTFPGSGTFHRVVPVPAPEPAAPPASETESAPAPEYAPAPAATEEPTDAAPVVAPVEVPTPAEA